MEIHIGEEILKKILRCPHYSDIILTEAENPSYKRRKYG